MGVELFPDKQIRILEGILDQENGANAKRPSIDLLSSDVYVRGPHFTSVLNFFDSTKLIKLDGVWEVPFQNEEGVEITSPDELLATFTILNHGELKKQLDDLKRKYPKKKKPLLRTQTTELIARATGELMSGTKLETLLRSLGVDKSLIVYPNTKWRMIQDALDYLVRSDRSEDVQALRNFFKEFCHPLTHGGDARKAKDFEKQLNGWVEYDGFRIIRGELISTDDDSSTSEPMIPMLEESGAADIIRENQKAKKSIETIIEQEKQQITEIKSSEELQIAKESWEAYKQVLDKIAHSIPRIADAVPTISVDLNALQVPVEHIENVMSKLQESKVFAYFIDKNSPVITTEPLRRFLSGDGVIIKDLERFQEIRKSTDELVESISHRWSDFQKLAETAAELHKKFTKHLEPILELTAPPATLPLPPSPRQIALEVEAERQAHTERLSGKERREKLKNDRIIAELNVPLKQHVLKTVLAELENFGNGIDAVEIDFFHFNFESNRFGIARFETFLNRLKDEGYLQSYARNARPMHGSKYSFVGLNKGKIVNFLSSGKEVPDDGVVKQQRAEPLLLPKALAESSNPKIKEETLLKFATAKRWEDIQFAFFDEGNRVEVTIGGEKVNDYHYSDLGFQKDSATSVMKAVDCWHLLKMFAATGGEIVYQSMDRKKKSQLQTRKKFLEQTLKTLFKIPIGDPILCDSSTKKYSCRISLSFKGDAHATFTEGQNPIARSQYLGIPRS